MKKRALVTGAGGFIGWHLTNFLKDKGYWVRGVDIKQPEFAPSRADQFIEMTTPVDVYGVRMGLRDSHWADFATKGIDEVYALAADMGGAGYLFTGQNDVEILKHNTEINFATISAAYKNDVKRYFFSSSACIYPTELQLTPDLVPLSEDIAYPANPDSPYGWEKLHTEHLCLAYSRRNKMVVRIARFHNIFGTMGAWNGGKEKAPVALCRKVIEAELNGTHTINVWGDGKQTRSFLYIDDCLEGIYAVMHSDYDKPINIGSDKMVSINELVSIILSNTKNYVNHADKYTLEHDLTKPQGVRGRNSDNSLCKEVIGWEPTISLEEGISKIYAWIKEQILEGKNA